MATRFDIPNSGSYLPNPGTPNQPLSFMPQNDPETDGLQELLNSLETARPPEPRQIGTWQKVLGGLGDAIQAMAAVRAGGQAPPVGPFAAQQRQQSLIQQEQATGAESYNRETRNKVRIGAFEEGLRAKREKEVAATRNANRSLRFVPTTINEGGVSRRVVDVYDPLTGEYLGRNEQGEAGYAPVVLASPGGYVRAQKSGGSAATPVLNRQGEPVLPQPPAGVVTSVAASEATLGGLDELWTAYGKVREETAGDEKLLDKLRQRAGTFVGETRMGGAFAPEYARYVASRRAALNAYIKSQTGAQFSVKELDRYETQYPEPWDRPDLAKQKLDVLRQRVLADMQAKLRAFPAAGGSTPTVDDILRQYDEERRANPTP